ncbi:uncharacterized protein L969DRAFT_95964 [Mixia osmundae IAM 14324]|uniref:MARVEL domain-containing protein n=1 Tax=Mixia osmundae (strain CBS 9802 / IAM 14324 / JCM 22182 / KY 12970) TaxID=764103 RepID=G7DWW4_MIXOS|nr:uncharacterized protein L969DRAFT_55636 [Mixia osmundae IAM 14324]XP_014566696.1 uncharacterized protein L969DRAFT_95964 [Mixia osmundae IAM 14324]KEI36163.1 hypothetical protein L969DRAFT_55636 [Mixia osmundae IAM 14324]KEI38131.1 hypothetical protein L969DRAFT_95964 [Mixia osmundae IAM 14324]GAA95061.1 hypothetical protein E5Q_01716 [Mixia osmundae IAM 14324]
MAIMKAAHPALFATIVFFSLIEIGISGALVGDYNRDGGKTSLKTATRFLLFASLWTFIFGIFYIFGFLRMAGNVLFSIASHGIWVFVTFIFWLAGAAALAQQLRTNPNFPHETTLRACEAFAWMNAIILAGLLVLIGLSGMKSSRDGNGFGGSLAERYSSWRERPELQQVHVKPPNTPGLVLSFDRSPWQTADTPNLPLVKNRPARSHPHTHIRTRPFLY